MASMGSKVFKNQGCTLNNDARFNAAPSASQYNKTIHKCLNVQEFRKK